MQKEKGRERKKGKEGEREGVKERREKSIVRKGGRKRRMEERQRRIKGGR